MPAMSKDMVMAAKYITGELGEKLLDIKGPAACDDWEGVVLRRGSP